jgi:hypothetical protein
LCGAITRENEDKIKLEQEKVRVQVRQQQFEMYMQMIAAGLLTKEEAKENISALN